MEKQKTESSYFRANIRKIIGLSRYDLLRSWLIKQDLYGVVLKADDSYKHNLDVVVSQMLQSCEFRTSKAFLVFWFDLSTGIKNLIEGSVPELEMLSLRKRIAAETKKDLVALERVLKVDGKREYAFPLPVKRKLESLARHTKEEVRRDSNFFKSVSRRGEQGLVREYKLETLSEIFRAVERHFRQNSKSIEIINPRRLSGLQRKRVEPFYKATPARLVMNLVHAIGQFPELNEDHLRLKFTRKVKGSSRVVGGKKINSKGKRGF